MTNEQSILIYKEGKDIRLDVQLKDETVWLTQKQMAFLFGKSIKTISEHIKNVYKDGELQEASAIRNFRNTATDGKIYETKFYNLDTIISVGYRVKSQQGVKFRIWATKTLKNFIVKGYAINEQRLLETKKKFLNLQNTINFIKEKSEKILVEDSGKDILDLLSSYAKTLTILDGYDKSKLKETKGGRGKFVLTYEESVSVISEIRRELIAKGEASDLFGNERDSSFSGIIRGLYQTFGDRELYYSLESKAAHILYLIIKDHPFSDGNKRVGSFLFVYFLDRNKALYRESGERKINDNTLVALALLVAESNPKDKEQMIALITQLLL